MADHQHRAAELLLEEVLQPEPPIKVEVVRRLIQQQNVRILQEQLRQRQPPLLPAAEARDLHPELCVGKAEPVKNLIDLVVDAVPTERLDLAFQPLLLLEQAIEFRALGRTHVVEDLFELAVGLVQIPEGALGLAAQRLVRVQFRILVQVARPAAALEPHGSAVGTDDPGEDLHQRALAAAVAPDHAHALAGLDRDRHAIENDALSERVTNIDGGQQRHGAKCRTDRPRNPARPPRMCPILTSAPAQPTPPG